MEAIFFNNSSWWISKSLTNDRNSFSIVSSFWIFPWIWQYSSLITTSIKLMISTKNDSVFEVIVLIFMKFIAFAPSISCDEYELKNLKNYRLLKLKKYFELKVPEKLQKPSFQSPNSLLYLSNIPKRFLNKPLRFHWEKTSYFPTKFHFLGFLILFDFPSFSKSYLLIAERIPIHHLHYEPIGKIQA